MVVEAFDMQLIVAPQFVCLLRRNGFDFLPFLLQLFQFVIILIGLFGRGAHFFDALNDMEFLLKVFLLFGLLLQEELCAPFLDHTHFGLENLFQLIGHKDVFLGIAALFKIITLLRFTFGHVHFVERCFELIDFFFCGIFVVSHNFFESFNHFSFAVISPFCCFLLRLWRSIHFLRLLFGR